MCECSREKCQNDFLHMMKADYFENVKDILAYFISEQSGLYTLRHVFHVTMLGLAMFAWKMESVSVD